MSEKQENEKTAALSLCQVTQPLRVVTDFALTETPDGTHGPLIGSSAASGLVFGEGPTMAAQYRDEAKGFDGYIIRKWQ